MLRRPAARSHARGAGDLIGDVDETRADTAAALGVNVALPEDAAAGRDLVMHASATSVRLQLCLDLLREPAFDVLLTGASAFDELPDVMARLAGGRFPALYHTLTYDEG